MTKTREVIAISFIYLKQSVKQSEKIHVTDSQCKRSEHGIP